MRKCLDKFFFQRCKHSYLCSRKKKHSHLYSRKKNIGI
uniref:Uncharacterized protein n=1 Tax=Arundo donax TaxID=35708 RepID=A0A0A9C7C5_ARUDO